MLEKLTIMRFLEILARKWAKIGEIGENCDYYTGPQLPRPVPVPHDGRVDQVPEPGADLVNYLRL
jgi:hypothetical protein